MCYFPITHFGLGTQEQVGEVPDEGADEGGDEGADEGLAEGSEGDCGDGGARTSTSCHGRPNQG